MAKVSLSFDTEVAKVAGVSEAIVLQNIEYWIAKNEANEKHFYEDRFWTYNSHKAFVKLFDWLSEDQIKRILLKLERMGYIKKGKFSQNKYDQTTFYALGCVPAQSIVRNGIIDQAKSPNGGGEVAGCNTDINTDINTNRSLIESSTIKIEVSKTPRELAEDFFAIDEEKIMNAFDISPENGKLVRDEIRKFRDYWTELNGSGTKQRWQQEGTFEVKKRLATWFSRVKSFSGSLYSKPDRMGDSINLF